MRGTPSGTRTGTRRLLACGLLAPLFVVVILVEGALRPDYASAHRFGSELALGERGWVQIANFVVTGMLVLAFSAGVRRTLAGGRAGVVAPVLGVIFGLCLIVGGVFVTDPKPGYPAGSTGVSEPSLAGTIHDANPIPFYLSLIALVVVMAWRFAKDGGPRPLVWYCVASAVLIPVTFALSAGQFDMATQSGQFHGLWQRVNLALSLGWIGVVAGYLLVAERQGAADRSGAAADQGEARIPRS
ncbi:DUF998 domain-containing protein [Spiractinospora alimapuensis]|uniref:DUF998 domain-containing protein n=1 Tax=Spiractinospora alimapuensis TaxID=2820884 RepID=UPI001F3F1048|nr:DUF998 domain-containing protein [Spiractinospora alimapuensis]QVQ50022.1 DUF998 domain-containing protein [Spiractinospora alimapuensis]